MTELTDAQVDDILRTVPSEAVERLGRVLDSLHRADRFALATWAPSEVFRGAVTMPYPRYSPNVDELVRVLYDAGVIVSFNWMQWEDYKRFKTKDDLAAASIADVVRYTITVIRSERFCDGAIKAHLEDGTLLAAVERVYAALTSPR